LNSRRGEKINYFSVGPFGEEIINGNSEKLIDMCEQNSLNRLNGYFKHQMIHQYTWQQDTQELRFIIDYIIAKCNSGLNFQFVSVFREMNVGIEHYLVKAKINEMDQRITLQTVQ